MFIVKTTKTISIASPKTLQITALGEELGYKHVESHFALVHRSLTREIAVFEKVQTDECPCSVSGNKRQRTNFEA
jgi:hypothetical protein